MSENESDFASVSDDDDAECSNNDHILPGIFNIPDIYKITENIDGKIKALCLLCKKKSQKTTKISGSLKSTSNFRVHIKVSSIPLIV